MCVVEGGISRSCKATFFKKSVFQSVYQGFVFFKHRNMEHPFHRNNEISGERNTADGSLHTCNVNREAKEAVANVWCACFKPTNVLLP